MIILVGVAVPASGSSLAAVEINRFHFIICDDDEFALPISLVGNLEVHNGQRLLKDMDLFNHHRINVTERKKI